MSWNISQFDTEMFDNKLAVDTFAIEHSNIKYTTENCSNIWIGKVCVCVSVCSFGGIQCKLVSSGQTENGLNY